LDPFRLEADRVLLLDQTRLPDQETWIEVRNAVEMSDAIARMRVRGAPAIGIAAALALGLEEALARGSAAERIGVLESAGRQLVAARPTAVNLSRAVSRVLESARSASADCRAARAEALALWDEDRAASRAIAEHGANLFPTEVRFLTHCHTGGLATGGGGTALAIILELSRRRGGTLEVWVTETRPLLQGARLTAWELRREGVPVRLIVDSAAAHTILNRRIEGVLVGADRIARNGDVANKIGTLPLALAAREAGIPFIVAAPWSTVDPSTPSGASIPIEERDESEVTGVKEVAVAPPGIRVENPAFDVTPARLVSAITTERGVRRGPHYDFSRDFSRG